RHLITKGPLLPHYTNNFQRALIRALSGSGNATAHLHTRRVCVCVCGCVCVCVCVCVHLREGRCMCVFMSLSSFAHVCVPLHVCVCVCVCVCMCVCVVTLSVSVVWVSEDAGREKVRAWGPGLETGMVGKSADFVVEAIGTEVGTLGKSTVLSVLAFLFISLSLYLSIHLSPSPLLH